MGQQKQDERVVADCFFLDVGHGSSNVVLLPVSADRRSAIVVDCGPRSTIPLEVLQRYADFIEVLLVSHNDIDHWGGVPNIIAQFKKCIGKVVFLNDRPSTKNNLYSHIRNACEAGDLPLPIRAERDNEPRILYDDSANSIRLTLVYPDMFANENARNAKNPNATSAVVLLDVGSRRVIFPGDSTIDSWQEIHRLAMQKRLECDVLAMPHHGGSLGTAADHEWLFGRAIKAEYGVISVGTSSFNMYRHPDAGVVDAMRRAGGHVLCTQITQQCCNNLERLRPGVIGPSPHSLSSSTTQLTKRKNSRNVGCASTVLVHLGKDVIRIERLNEHRQAVDRLVTMDDNFPLCRRMS